MLSSFGRPPSALAFLDSVSDPTAFLSDDVVLPFIEFMGVAATMRTYEPPTPLGDQVLGFGVGVEATGVFFGDRMKTALEALGTSTSDIGLEYLPIPKVHVHKSFGPRFDVSFAILPGQLIGQLVSIDLISNLTTWALGGEIILIHPDHDEVGGGGYYLGLRFNYGYFDFTYPFSESGVEGDVGIESEAYTPSLAFGARLGPMFSTWVNFGYSYYKGLVSLTGDFEVSGVTVSASSSKEGSSKGFWALTGFGMRFPFVNLFIALQGGYHQLGYNQLGAKVGFSF